MTMDYTHFRFQAVVDWIELEIRTATPTNFQAIRRAAGLSYVTAQDAGDGGAATVFRFRLYDPQCWDDVTAAIATLGIRYPLASMPTVTAIEIALDAYSRGVATRQELAELTATYYRHLTHLASNNRRLYRDYKGSGKAMPQQFSSLVRHLGQGWQIGIGNTDDDHYQHAYFKTTDHNGEDLKKHEHRARIENRLQGASLPCSTFDEWGRFRFESLSKFYRFRTIKEDLDPTMTAMMNCMPQIGEQHTRNRKEGGTRLHAKGTKADRALNEAARYALRELSRRWQRKAVPCGNPGELAA